jgi:hypothetical protein
MTTTTAARSGPPPVGVPTAPPLPEDVHALLRRLRMPHTRAAAPDVLATARAQRWEPVEVLRALFTAEVAGRDRSSLATRRARAAFPTGKTFHAWKPEASSIPAPTQQALRTLEWLHRKGATRGRTVSSGHVDRRAERDDSNVVPDKCSWVRPRPDVRCR